MRGNKGEKVEVELEFDDGFVCSFEPDFRVQKNTADHSAVQWRLSGTGNPVNMGILRDEFQEEITIYPPIFSGSDV